MNTDREQAINRKGTFLLYKDYEDYSPCLSSSFLLFFLPFSQHKMGVKRHLGLPASLHGYQQMQQGPHFLAGGTLGPLVTAGCQDQEVTQGLISALVGIGSKGPR